MEMGNVLEEAIENDDSDLVGQILADKSLEVDIDTDKEWTLRNPELIYVLFRDERTRPMLDLDGCYDALTEQEQTSQVKLMKALLLQDGLTKHKN